VKEVTWLELEIGETGATGGSWVWRVASWCASPWASRAATASNPPTAEILIQNFRFDPPTISVPVGTTAIWTNHDEEIR